MVRPASRIRDGVAILGLVIVPLGIHAALATRSGGSVWAGALVAAEAGLIAWIALGFVPGRLLRWIGSGSVLVVTAAVWRFSSDGIVVSSAIPHAIAYLAILALFASSLTPGRKAIATLFAEKSRGELSPAILRYTRRVTWAWCAFCVAQLLVSLLLMLFAPARIWSMFINVCNLPLLVAMFCCEFAWRKWRHGTSESLMGGFRMARQIRTNETV